MDGGHGHTTGEVCHLIYTVIGDHPCKKIIKVYFNGNKMTDKHSFCNLLSLDIV